mmetsp:Transcript_23729/g.27647  ORF Transcript_23729/g.27647 Transcript_23729/m.27647 type:complete len:222 (-) Transcript_23729:1-666(-)
MGEGESAGRAEKHLLHALHLFVLDGTGEEGEASLTSSTAWVLNVTATVALRGHGALEAMNHSHEEADDLLVVLLPVDVALDLVDGIALLNHEILARAHLVLDGVEQHVSLLAQLLLNQLDELEKLGPVTRLVNLDEVIVARVDEEEDSALGLVARFNPVLVEQPGHLCRQVHVEELTEILMAERLDHLPGVILGSRQLEQLHLLWSPNHGYCCGCLSTSFR